ncbi:uncharacterized protein [Palaemon carinicauda]|uniref:uncharacterized protein n=1 Tax=Palaemon carinicauda TaxID=392227 RepID=UPI0035B58C13
MPLHGKHGHLPETRDIALRRMHSLRKKLLKDGNYYKQYSAFMTEMQQKGYAEQVTTASPGNVWYIPHSGVQHPDKPDKVHVVFDCASKVEGTSLNDLLLQGPDMMNSLLGVLVKFRGSLFAYRGDINIIFYQVRVPEQQRDYLRFFWWENSLDEEPKEWKMAVHLFGACSSPSIANFMLKQTASDFKNEFSEEARFTVANNFNVDDCLRAEDRKDALLVNLLEVKELCKKGRFTLTKFSSPCVEFMSSIPREWYSRSTSELIDESESHKTKALGVQWNLATDELGVRAELVSVSRTKRDLLSAIASIYDPLSILAAVLIEGRVIMQDHCRLKIAWDMELDSDTYGPHQGVSKEAEPDQQDKCAKKPEGYFMGISHSSTVAFVLRCKRHGFRSSGILAGLGSVGKCILQIHHGKGKGSTTEACFSAPPRA